jgi:hypothetical protein
LPFIHELPAEKIPLLLGSWMDKPSSADCFYYYFREEYLPVTEIPDRFVWYV